MTQERTGVEPREHVPLPALAHHAGVLDLGDSSAPDAPATAVERLLLTERLHRYCLAYDERRIDRLANCFTPDAVWEGLVAGQTRIGPFEGREAIVTWLSRFWPHQRDQRRHMVLNTVVETQSAESARTVSYLLLLSSNGEQARFETMGFYRLDLRRDADAWRIGRFFAGFDAPFWPGKLQELSDAGKRRHGVGVASSD